VSRDPRYELIHAGHATLATCLSLFGLVPKQHSSGGKDDWLGSISKQADRYLRSLFVAGAFAVIRYAKVHGTEHRP
jgi:transposase